MGRFVATPAFQVQTPHLFTPALSLKPPLSPALDARPSLYGGWRRPRTDPWTKEQLEAAQPVDAAGGSFFARPQSTHSAWAAQRPTRRQATSEVGHHGPSDRQGLIRGGAQPFVNLEPDRVEKLWAHYKLHSDGFSWIRFVGMSSRSSSKMKGKRSSRANAGHCSRGSTRTETT